MNKRIRALYGDLLDRLQTVSGVRGVALSQPALLSGGVSSTGMFVPGPHIRTGRPARHQHHRCVAELFETMRIR